MAVSNNFEKNINQIQAIFYDFDGVMTDNRVLLDQHGTESVMVNRSDGYAVACFKKHTIHQAIISTEINPVVERRAEKLKIPVVHGVDDKGEIIKSYCRENGIDLKHSIFMGNDLNDLPAFEAVGFKAAPADAEEEILKIADWVSCKNGGYGCIRDLYRWLTSGKNVGWNCNE